MIGGHAAILEAGFIMSEREKKLAQLIWPNEQTKDNMCLHCGIKKRNHHSWFCRDECEDVYVGQRIPEGIVDEE